jgi:ABC transport system ATP-binding/permease protein
MLVLDEPTNDLDVDTLELLEDLLADYEGTLLLVSHDRTFLDNVVTNTLVFEGDGKVRDYAGGYEDWQRQSSAAERSAALKPTVNKLGVPAPLNEKRGDSKRRLSYKEQRELESLPGKIEALEAEQAKLQTRMGEGDFYRQPSHMITAGIERLETVKKDLEECYARWQALESQANATS